MARIHATKWLQKLDEARAQALAGTPDGIHDVRVATRKLRAWLSLSGHPEPLIEELRWLGHQLSALRDLDVLDETLTDDARRRLRPPAIDQAHAALNSERWRILRAALDATRAPRIHDAKRELRRIEREVMGLKLTLDPASIHARRRGLRPLRYARRWLDRRSPEFKAEQVALSALCDLFALERFAAAHDPANAP